MTIFCSPSGSLRLKMENISIYLFNMEYISHTYKSNHIVRQVSKEYDEDFFPKMGDNQAVENHWDL